GAKWTPAPRVVDRLHYRQDRVGYVQQGFTHLFVVPAGGGTARPLTSGRWNVGARFDGLALGAGFDWTPNGTAIVFDGLADTTWDAQYRSSRLYVVDATSGAVRPLVSRPGAWSDPVVSPDGRLVAFTGHDSTERTYRTSDVWVIGVDGTGMRDLSRALDRDPGHLAWAPDGKGVFFTAPDRGAVNVYYADVAGGVRAVTRGPQVFALGSVARNFTAAAVRSDPSHPEDVVRLDLRHPGAVQRLTDVNDDVLANKRLGAVEEVWYASSGGARVQGWAVKPPGFDPARRYPLVLSIHGGPFAMYDVGFSYAFQNFAANGYLVLYTNPRGSTGYGDAFAAAIERDYPGPDYDDLMAGVDTLGRRGYVDTTRLYVTGCSGGGVLSSWVIGHTSRFAAAAVRCPVIDWISMAGETDIPFFTHSFFPRPFWERPDEWLAHSSLMYVGRVTTPTLLMTGELDRRTPIAQTEEYYAALKLRGVETVMLRFNDEYHGTGAKPSNWMRTQLYMLSWFARHRRGGPEAGAAGAAGGAAAPRHRQPRSAAAERFAQQAELLGEPAALALALLPGGVQPCRDYPGAPQVADQAGRVVAAHHGQPADVVLQHLGDRLIEELVGIRDDERAGPGVEHGAAVARDVVESAHQVAARDDAREPPRAVHHGPGLAAPQHGIE